MVVHYMYYFVIVAMLVYTHPNKLLKMDYYLFVSSKYALCNHQFTHCSKSEEHYSY